MTLFHPPRDRSRQRTDTGADRQTFTATGDGSDDRAPRRTAANEFRFSMAGLVRRN